jgi:hypothetical protein
MARTTDVLIRGKTVRFGHTILNQPFDSPDFTVSGGLWLPTGESYFGTPLAKLVSARAYWLISLLMLQSLSSVILTKFAGLIEVRDIVFTSSGPLVSRHMLMIGIDSSHGT